MPWLATAVLASVSDPWSVPMTCGSVVIRWTKSRTFEMRSCTDVLAARRWPTRIACSFCRRNSSFCFSPISSSRTRISSGVGVIGLTGSTDLAFVRLRVACVFSRGMVGDQSESDVSCRDRFDRFRLFCRGIHH